MKVASTREDDALEFKIGTYEEGRAAIGMRSELYTAELEISLAMAQLYCGQIQDANPSYWDEDFAIATWGARVAPFGLITTFGRALPWRPGGGRQRQNILRDVPLPGTSIINTSTETTYFKPLHIGDWLHAYDEVIEVSTEKTTRLGVGHFVTAASTYFDQRDELVGRHQNVAFRFVPST